MGFILKIKKELLLLLAGLVWIIGGSAVLRISIIAAQQGYSGWSAAVSLAFYILFHLQIFGPLVKKHTARIIGSKENHAFFWTFFDAKSWAMMFFMMAMGTSLRLFGVLPSWWIASIYGGIGFALCVAGLNFVLNYVRVMRNRTPEGAPTAR